MLVKNCHHLLENLSHFWQTQWETVWRWFGNDEFNMVVWGTFTVTFAIFWLIGLIFLMIDLTDKLKFLQKYKIQKTSTYPVAFKKVFRDSTLIMLCQLVCGAPMAFLYYHTLMWRGYDSKRSLPALPRMLLEVLFFILVEEILYYYLHRFLHTAFMYRHVHKVHHSWKTPIAITAAFCHPIEHVCVNIFPITLGPVLLGSHLATAWLWFCIATLSTLISHSGFPIPQFPHPEIHDLHHTRVNRNYGTLGLMDRLHGTYDCPKSWKIQ